MLSEHTKKLLKEQKVGEALIEVSILMNTIEAYYGEYTFYQCNIRGQKGCIIALPFFTYNEKKIAKFEGYLIYHDKENYGYSEDELKKLGIETIANYSPSGMARNLSPLPYKPIRECNIEDAINSLIEKNTKVNLTDNLSL
jgi:hypothetical protein